MDMPELKPKETPAEKARADAARIRRRLNDVKTALDSPRCSVIWRKIDAGDMVACWIEESCEVETEVNVSALQRKMKELAAAFGAEVEKSRKGNAVSIELPNLKGIGHGA